MDRRNFIKTSCILCMGVGGGLSIASLASCSNMKVIKTTPQQNIISIPLSELSPEGINLIRAKNLENDIALLKNAKGGYTSLLMRCTHADTGLTYTGNSFDCSMHGSSFNLSGKVKKGPAEKSLKTFETKTENNQVIINLNH